MYRNSKQSFIFALIQRDLLRTSGFPHVTIKDLHCSLYNCICILSPAVIENNEILYRDYVDISVAVATPKVCASSGLGCLKFG